MQTRRPRRVIDTGELRLSLFAQPLGAQGPISVQRIRKQLAG